MSIQALNISKRFGQFAALDNVDLEIPSGELVALLGPSGSGKTTLLRVIAGLEFADAGSVQFDGRDISDRTARERRVGFVFQHYALFRHMTVFENIAFGLRVRPRESRPSKKQVAAKVLPAKTVEKLTTDKCAAFHKQVFVPNNAIYLTTVGYGTGALLGRGIKRVAHVYSPLGASLREGPYAVAGDVCAAGATGVTTNNPAISQAVSTVTTRATDGTPRDGVGDEVQILSPRLNQATTFSFAGKGALLTTSEIARRPPGFKARHASR